MVNKMKKNFLYGIRRRAAALALAGAMVFGMAGDCAALAEETEAQMAAAGSDETAASGETEFRTETLTGTAETGTETTDETTAEAGQAEAADETPGAEAGQTEAPEETTDAEAGRTEAAAEETEAAAGAQNESGSPDAVAEAAEEAASEEPLIEESAELDEVQGAEDDMAAKGQMKLTASIEGQTPLYDDNETNIVWSKNVAAGSRVTLKADIANIDPGSIVTFTWTQSGKNGVLEQQTNKVVEAGKTDISDQLPGRLVDEGTYAYFCTVTVLDEKEVNKKVDHVFAYVIKDPLTIETKDTDLHVAPYDASGNSTGNVTMEVKASSAIPSDTFTKYPPFWYTADQFDGISTEILKTGSPTVLDTKATLKGVNSSSAVVTCRIASKFSPEKVYGKRYVTFNIDTVNHTWTDYKVTKDSTIWADGTKERDCTACGYKETLTIPKLTPSVSGNMDTVILQKGTSTKLYKLTLQNGDYVTKWTAADHDICTVTGQYDGDCTIKARQKKGQTTVTAELASGLSITVPVKVQKIKVRTQKINNVPQTLTLKKGRKFRLKPELYPLTSQFPVTYSSGNKNIATVGKKGLIRAKKPGRCRIFVKSRKVTAVIQITVTGVDATEIKGVRNVYNMRQKKTRQLKVKLAPANSTSRITYKSSNRAVARVTKTGKIRTRKKGTAVITITAVNMESESVVRQITVNVR